MRPTSQCPLATRSAPTRITTICAPLRSMLVIGPTRAIMPLAFFSLPITSRETASKRARSASVLESALMTRMPAASSRTRRTSWSLDCCT